MFAALAVLVAAQCPPPTATVTIVPEAGATDLNGYKLPRVTWSVTCPPQSASCPNVPSANLSLLRTEFAADPSELLGQGTGFSGASGEGPLPGQSSSLIGANLQFSALAECNNPGSALRVSSAPVVFAPTLNKDALFVAERDASDALVGTFPADAIPAGRKVELRPSFGLELAPNEQVTVRVQGPGVDWSKQYSFPSRARSSEVGVAFRDDSTARFTFTGAGTATVTMELAGVRSAAASFTVVAGGTGGGSGGTGGGSAGNGTGGGGAPQGGGCSATPGLFTLLAALTLAGRRGAAPAAASTRG
ncbi:MAG: hypothetical protein JNK82_40720 [Myxococcaceae bacterium]|nr:hypothetical protein [Myxococcaceae bacterium]